MYPWIVICCSSDASSCSTVGSGSFASPGSIDGNSSSSTVVCCISSALCAAVAKTVASVGSACDPDSRSSSIGGSRSAAGMVSMACGSVASSGIVCMLSECCEGAGVDTSTGVGTVPSSVSTSEAVGIDCSPDAASVADSSAVNGTSGASRNGSAVFVGTLSGGATVSTGFLLLLFFFTITAAAKCDGRFI